jgi:nucleolar protein 14
MPKGSQLLQLKSALSHAGITGQSQSNGKKRKRTGSQEQDKDIKAAKLKEIHQKLNPFDVKITKLKHDVGGRKLKGITGRPAQSKQAGMEQVRPYLKFLRHFTNICSIAQENALEGV